MSMRRGFTLIELIVVIAIVGLLVALALPSLKSGKESGVTLLCTNNLKELNFITAIYCDDNLYFPQGFCGLPACLNSPPEGGYPGNHSYDWPGWWWFNYLSINKPPENKILWCPARKRMKPPFCEDILWSNYGINSSIAKWASDRPAGEFEGPPLRKTDIRQSSNTLLYMDSGYALISWKAAAEGVTNLFDNNPLRENSFYLPGLDMNKNRLIHPEQQPDAVNGRHPRQTVNVGFADGHVQKEKTERLSVELTEDGKPSAAYLWSAGR